MGTTSPWNDVELTDPQTNESIQRSAYIHLECTACKHEWMFELGNNHLTGPCPECSETGTEENRTPSTLTVTIWTEDIIQLPTEIEAETESILANMESEMESWMRRIQNMTTEGWEIESVDSMKENTQIIFRREITPDDNITYDNLVTREKRYEKQLTELKTKSNG